MTDQSQRRRPSTFRRRASLFAGAAFATGAALTAGCLERPAVEQTPTTSNIFVEQVINTEIEAIDLLFVIDNSVSMADKQEILQEAVPKMVSRLVTPDCVNPAGERQVNDGQDCASYGADYAVEFTPIDDIHIGVITSSIGGFGSTNCQMGDSVDKSMLIPKVRPDADPPVPDPTGQGFLLWDGTASAESFSQNFADHVAAAGEEGCGFEAPLEAWYRFLVDPAPPADIALNENNQAVSTEVENAILAQRQEFLRPQSLVAIVVLTDENDCSAMEGGSYYKNAGFGWLVAEQGRPFEVHSDMCDQNPNDLCCYSCLQPAPEGCNDTCPRNPVPTLPPEQDRANVRCFDNKRRFGIDLLYPTQRYVDGLSKATIVNSRTGQEVPNPLLSGTGNEPEPRQPDLVFFAGIVGVPWQDIATEETLDDPNSLEYMTARELATTDPELNVDRWAVILGEPHLPMSAPRCNDPNLEPHPDCGEPPVPPLDPFMIESIEPRSSDLTNPITGTSPIQPGTGNWSAINGHEYDNSVDPGDGLPANDDLQYSCIFPLSDDAVKTDCTEDDFACDCGDEPSKGRPLCKPTPDSAAQATTTQRYGKAYPSTRVLRVLRDFGENSIVGSICPKLTEDPNHPSFGYNPAVDAIVDRLAEKLGGQCLPRELSLNDQGEVPCTVVEAIQGTLDCQGSPGREQVPQQIRDAVIKQLEATGRCSRDSTAAGSTVACSDYSMCAIQELEGQAQQECFSTALAEAQDPGFCYIDPAKGPAAGGMDSGPNSPCTQDENTWGNCTNPNVSGCGATERRLLRFVGPRTPEPNSITIVACVGEAASEGGTLTDLPEPTEPQPTDG